MKERVRRRDRTQIKYNRFNREEGSQLRYGTPHMYGSGKIVTKGVRGSKTGLYLDRLHDRFTEKCMFLVWYRNHKGPQRTSQFFSRFLTPLPHLRTCPSICTPLSCGRPH